MQFQKHPVPSAHLACRKHALAAAPRLCRLPIAPHAVPEYVAGPSSAPEELPQCSVDPNRCADIVLQLARDQQYTWARAMFEVILEANPNMCKLWVSYAQVGRGVCGRLPALSVSLCLVR